MSAISPYRTIVVGTDGSALADPTVARAALLAAAEGAALVIVCAYSRLSQSDTAKSLGLSEPWGGEVLGRQAAAEAVAKATATASGLGAAIAGTVLGEGEAAAVLLRAAAEHQASLLVIGAIRDVSIAERLLGTVASTVVRRAACEVLVVRPPADWGDISELEVPSQAG